MGREDHLLLVSETGEPLQDHIQEALNTLHPRFRRQFPVITDESVVAELLEHAGRAVARHEQVGGPLARLHPFAWVALKNAAASWLRSSRRRVDAVTLPIADARTSTDGALADYSSAEHIERTVLLQQILSQMTPIEQEICLLKKAGFSSAEIAAKLGVSANAVDTAFCRARQRVKKSLGHRRRGA